jgi:glutamine synthetase
MEATFMARPYDDYAGSGTHIHISMLDDAGNNVFCGDTELGSDVLRHAVGGLFATMEESMAIYAPNANSYRRFQEDSYVPLAKTWGWNNRTVAVRIPTGADEARRVEHRVAGADANPFLLTAVLLAGIHHGITQHIEPAEPVAGNAYQEPHAPLPARWYEALAAFEQRSILGDYLDPRFCKAYLASKHAELRQFEARITPTEYQWYLRLV